MSTGDLAVAAPLARPAESAGPLADPTNPQLGLTTAEAEQRLARGLGNVADLASSRSYAQIVRENLLTFLNITLVGIGVVLVALELPKDAILTCGLAILNAAIGVVQEVFAKRRLDKIALLSRAKSTVIRDGAEQEQFPEQLVIGDILALKAGDQAVLDGTVVGDGQMEMDESLLTGESDAIHKHPGDPVYAGSFCLSGAARYQATKVGKDSVANRIVAGARAFKLSLTPLQRDVNMIVRILIAIATTMLAMLILSSVVWGFSLQETAVAAAVVLGIIPSGLFLMITITYSMASIRLARQNALVQQVNAVESLSNVNVFCMDKTGTLTSNSLVLQEVQPTAGDEAAARRVLGAMAHSAQAANKTTEAIAAACPGPTVALVDEVPFSSARKWSAIVADADALRGVYALGAPEFLGPLLAHEAGQPPAHWLEQGLRVLLVASSPSVAPIHDGQGEPKMPADLAPLTWIAIRDELRPHSKETLEGFQAAGIQLKIISGDNPDTVAALARQAGLRDDATLVSGVDLAKMGDAEFDAAAVSCTVFGRITPEQKARLVDALQRVGHYVAMTGDGVNDVMSLKKANLGIAMESGSQATRAAADIVLLKDAFGALPVAFAEGQRVRRGLQGVLGLFLSRVFVVVAALMLCGVVRIGFPFSPGNITLLTLLTVGIPTFGLSLWARPGTPPRSLIRSLVSFVLPAAVTISVAAFAVYTLFFFIDDVALSELRSSAPGAIMARDLLARDALTYLLVLAGVGLVLFAAPPTPWWAVLEPSEGEWRPTALALAMLPLYVVLLAIEPVRDFFGSHLLAAWEYLVIALIALAWVLVLRYVYASRLFDRYLGLPNDDGGQRSP